MNKNLFKKWKGKTGQEIQDEIFRKMSADKKLKLASGLWELGKTLQGRNYISHLYDNVNVKRR